MQLVDVSAAGADYSYKWPSGSVELYKQWIEYRGVAADGDHSVRIGFGTRATYGRDRVRVVVWIDGRPHAEFLGADDYARSGDVLAEIRLSDEPGERMCRYPDEAVPERYSGLPVVGLPTRVTGQGVHSAWSVVANVSDHRVLATLASLRRLERTK